MCADVPSYVFSVNSDISSNANCVQIVCVSTYRQVYIVCRYFVKCISCVYRSYSQTYSGYRYIVKCILCAYRHIVKCTLCTDVSSNVHCVYTDHIAKRTLGTDVSSKAVNRTLFLCFFFASRAWFKFKNLLIESTSKETIKDVRRKNNSYGSKHILFLYCPPKAEWGLKRGYTLARGKNGTINKGQK